MKKVLVLSALGCIATVGAVFAAFTLDPTSESEEIPSVNVDVDLSSHVFSTFERVNEINYEDGRNQLWEHVPIGEPQYHFKPKDVISGSGTIVGATLDLHCDDYDINDMAAYCLKRKQEPDPSETEAHKIWEEELAELAPTGYAFKYEYDSDFLNRIKADDTKPEGMQDWEYAIYKTTFSSGLTKSDFKAHADAERTEDPRGLDEFGIHYQDPDATKPNYKEFVWDKSKLDREDPKQPYPWISGDPDKPGFYIQPDVVDGVTLNSGIVFFTGAEITENLFAGNFIDADAVKACEAYLNEKDSTGTKYLHRDFALKIKATEYFKVEQHELTHSGDSTTFEAFNQQPDTNLMVSGNRYCFDFKIDEQTDQLFKDGFEIDKFVVLDTGENKLNLVSEEAVKSGDDLEGALGLKVMLDSPNNGISDITRYFKYGIEGEKEYSIYYDNTVASNAVGYLPEKGDTIKFNFIFRKNNIGLSEKYNWSRAQLKMVKPIKKAFELTDSGTGTYSLSLESPVSIPNNETYRFEALVNPDRYFDTLSITSDGTTPVALTSAIAKPYILGKDGTLTSLSSDLYKFNDDGSMTFEDKKIRGSTVFEEGTKYVVDIRHNDDSPLTVKTASLTTTIIPKEYYFYNYQPGGVALETGYFEMEPSHHQAISSGMLLNFNCYIENESFWKTIGEFKVDVTGYTAKLKLAVLDGGLNPIPLGAGSAAPTFSVKRINKEGTLVTDDTDKYEYDSATSTIVTKDTGDFIKTWNQADGYQRIVISVNYEGANITFNTARVTLEITSPTTK